MTHPVPDTSTDTGTAAGLAAPDDLRAALETHFGFADFQPGQRPVIEDVMARRPTLAVMPTGAGKSLCYQLPAMLLDGLTLVVSPLIALMKDQVDGLRARGIAADYLNSALDPEAQRAVLDRVIEGRTRLLYAAPERFRSGRFLSALDRRPPVLLAIDEAHCISRWGHDFRPDYLRLGEAIGRLRPERLLACTATATPDVRADITGSLDLAEPAVHVHGFLRPNLFLESVGCGSEREKTTRLLRFAGRPELAEGALIVYAGTRKRVERFADALRGALGRDAVVHYHAGLDDTARARAQERFIGGAARVAVATNAFGMGVDRGDVRAVVHVDLPRSVEDYYQEIGRAGRDREPAHCLLLHQPADGRLHEFFIEQSHPAPALVQSVWDAILDAGEGGASFGALAHDLKTRRVVESESAFEASVGLLTRVDAVRPGPGGFLYACPGAPPMVAQLGIDFGDVQRHADSERGRLRAMKRYPRHTACRHAYILDYFGEAHEGDCPGCDRCAGHRVARRGAERSGPPTEDEVLAIRKALAGVARAEGRYGTRKVAGMLVGSRAKDIADTPLVRLSTFGVLEGWRVDDAAALLRTLVDHDLCRLDGLDYPLIVISAAGWAVMQGKAVPEFRPPAPAVAAPRSRGARGADRFTDLDADERALAERIRAWRTAQARETGKPPYTIFADRTLLAIVAAPPTDEASFLAISGLGPAKWARFGDALLALLEAAPAPDGDTPASGA